MKKVMVISGASSGLGEYLAQYFSESHEVVSIARRECQVEGVKSVLCDLSVPEEINRAVQSVERKYDHINVLINNAAFSDGKSLTESSVDAITRSFQVNTIGPVLLTKGLLPLLKRPKTSNVIMINSIGGLKTKKNRVSYSGSKWGLTGATKVLTEELKDEGIAVAGIYPAALEKEMKTATSREGAVEYGRIREVIETIVSASFNGVISSVEIE